jgi:hypothetical protein
VDQIQAALGPSVATHPLFLVLRVQVVAAQVRRDLREDKAVI